MTVPAWLAALPAAAAAQEPGWYSRFLSVGGSSRKSAVLALLAPGPDGPEVLLTERPRHMRKHASQVSFPGGGLEPGDAGPVDAALREAWEETGLDPAAVEVVCTLPELHIPVSRNDVTPVVGWADARPEVHAAHPEEVARVLWVPLATLADPACRVTVLHPRGHVGPGFDLPDDVFVWGFTAGLLDKLLLLLGLDRPWDARRERPLPERFLAGAGPRVLPANPPDAAGEPS